MRVIWISIPTAICNLEMQHARVSWKLIEKQEVLYGLSQDASKLSILDLFECEEDSSSRDKFDY